MTLSTENEEVCKAILRYFDELYKISHPLTEENILEHERTFIRINETEIELHKLKRQIKSKKLEGNLLDEFDFKYSHFKKEHLLLSSRAYGKIPPQKPIKSEVVLRTGF